MLQSGDFAFDTLTGANVQILEKINAWGYTSYRVFNPSTGAVYKATEEQLNKDGGTNAYDENYLRYVTLLSKIKNETSGGLLSSLSNGVIPLPHQLYALNRALETNTIRYILADEVGLGKTIEAGMIIKELKARGLVQRVLVVCPTGLVTQWASEMQEKFNEKFNIILPSDYDTIRRITDNDDVYGQFDQIISPMDSIKPMENHIGWTEEQIEEYNQERIYSVINSGWDLIIIDESHKVAGSSSDVARYKLAHLLSQASPYLLLLTATPHNGKTEPFLRLVRLLDEEAFPNAKSVVKEQVAPYLIRSEKRETIDNNGNRLFKGRTTHLISLNWDERHTMQRELYKLVTDYVSKSYNKAIKNRKKNMCLIFLLIMMQRMVTSSTAAIRKSLERRLLVLKEQATEIKNLSEEDLTELNIEDGAEEVITAMSLDAQSEITELENIISVAKQAEYQYKDVKVEYLLDTIEKIFSEDPEQKIIIFTEFRATQEYLERILLDKEYTVSTLNGNMSIDERNLAVKDFRDRANIFISTDAGGEGLNLQFANIVINYDCPWNPMMIEQRCGRADRIGQKRDVHIFNYIIEDTVENRVRSVLEAKLSVILKELGVDKYSDVLDSDVAEVDFTNAYMSSIAKPNDIESAIKPVENEVRQQVTNAQKYKDILHDEKDLSTLVGAESEFDIEEALRSVLTYYNFWQGIDNKLIDRISIADKDVTKHLNDKISQDRFSPLISVGIENFPNEEGYFMLWELSLTEKEEDRKIIPVFVNSNFILRPMAGKRIMEVFLNPGSVLHTHSAMNISSDEYAKLEQMSMEFCYTSFTELRDKHLSKNRETYEKYTYALQLRTEATEHIGIDNIRKSRLEKLSQEKKKIEEKFEKGKQVCPEFRLVILVKLEA